MSAKIVIGLAEGYGGARAAGKQTTSAAVDLARQLNDPAQLATAQIGLRRGAVAGRRFPVGSDQRVAGAGSIRPAGPDLNRSGRPS